MGIVLSGRTVKITMNIYLNCLKGINNFQARSVDILYTVASHVPVQ